MSKRLLRWFGDRRNTTVLDMTHNHLELTEKAVKELYDMVKDPNEWTNLAAKSEYAEVINTFKKDAPKNQAPLSKFSHYNINQYFRDKVSKNGNWRPVKKKKEK